MKWNHGLFIISILIMLLGLWYVLHSKTHQNLRHTTPRTFGYEIKPEFEFVYAGSTIESWKWHNNTLVILDRHSQLWYRMDTNGKVLDTLGNAGLAPYQNQQVKNFAIEEGFIQSVDVGARVIKSESPQFGIRSFRKVQESIWDGIPLGMDSFLLLNDDSEHFGFFTLCLNDASPGKVRKISSAFSHNRVQNSNVVYEGFFVRGDSIHYYVCARSAGIIQLDRKGRFIRAFETLDKTPPPRIIERRAANLVIFDREPDEIVNYAGTEYGGELHILSQVAFVPTSSLRVDIYDKTGSYRTSIEVPNNGESLPTNILRSPTHLYVCYEDLTIIGYELQAI